jgi:histidinol dehydrogenase
VRITALSKTSVISEMAALRTPGLPGGEVHETVAQILADVRSRGDKALVEITARLDWPEASVAALAVPPEELESAYQALDPQLVAALEMAKNNCMSFHRREMTPGWEVMGFQWQRLGVRYLPMARAGLYVPGGLGSYASTVIMNACPAVVAGVEELLICTPPDRTGAVNQSVLAAARLMGVERVFRVGGAQAVASMAYGTETIPRVDVICGPGNAYVAEAKRQVYGAVGIDSLAGPSEVLILADSAARPDWVAVDMLAQEEHGSGATAVLVAETQELCRAVEAALASLRARAARGRGGTASRQAPRVSAAAAPESAAAVVEDADARLTAFFPAPGEDFLSLAEAAAEAYAPEHLEIQLAGAREFLPRVRSAGAVFIGGLSATAFGDYIAGSNHVLPTGGSARFSSPLSVQTFLRRSSHVEMTDRAVEQLTPLLAKIAESEGFYFHRLSAELRLDKK